MGAKIINSICFENFYNYFGNYKNNCYIFPEGLNIIVADNGAGKSKFFNGMLWLLKDIVYDSELKKEDRIEDVRFKVVSDKAKEETSIGGSLRVGVKLSFQDSNNEYIIEKYFNSKRIKEGNTFSEKCWKLDEIEREVSKRDLYLNTFHQVYEIEEQKRIIESVILPGLQPYALLQGEEIDKIIDFSRKDSLNNAIDKLTNINRIKSLVCLSEYLFNRSTKDLDSQRKLHTKNSREFDDEITKKEKFKDELVKKESLLKASNEILNKAKEEKANLLNSITNAEKRLEFRKKIELLENRKQNLSKEYEELLNKINSYFFDPDYSWLLLNLDGEMKVFSNLRDNYLESRMKTKLTKEIRTDIFTTVLPDGSPDYVSLEKMLEQELCFVCGRDAKKGSDEWHYIKNVKERPRPEISKEETAKNDFKDFFGEIQMNSQEFYKKINSIPESVKSLRNKLSSYESQIREILKQKELAEQELFQFGGIGKDPIEKDKDKNILESYANANQRIGLSINEIDRYKKEIDDLRSRIAKIDKTIAELGGSDFPKEYEETSEILKDIYTVFVNTKDRIFSEILSRLETNSNAHFQKLTVDNNADGGLLRLTRTSNESVILEVVDKNGNPITGLSEGFQRMKKLAVIMAIISSRQNQQTLDYPLIADAPLSAFGKGFIEGFFNEVPNVFNQSIILVKELYDKTKPNKLSDTGERLLHRKGIGSIYLNEIEENKSQSERITKIIRYK